MKTPTHTTSTVDLDRLVRLSDTYWIPWFAALLELAALHGITTSDDADLWWNDFGAGKTPRESMDGFLASDEGIQFLNSLPNTADQERKSPASDGFKFNNPNEL
jgi:hypothetical protein